MVNAAPILHLIHTGMNLAAAGLGCIGGVAAGRPVKRRIIRKWAKRPDGTA